MLPKGREGEFVLLVSKSYFHFHLLLLSFGTLPALGELRMFQPELYKRNVTLKLCHTKASEVRTCRMLLNKRVCVLEERRDKRRESLKEKDFPGQYYVNQIIKEVEILGTTF